MYLTLFLHLLCCYLYSVFFQLLRYFICRYYEFMAKVLDEDIQQPQCTRKSSRSIYFGSDMITIKHQTIGKSIEQVKTNMDTIIHCRSAFSICQRGIALREEKNTNKSATVKKSNKRNDRQQYCTTHIIGIVI